MIDPCCCNWGCNCRVDNGKCKVCAKKAERLSGQEAEGKGETQDKTNNVKG